jgi:predicted N-acetyltransferase YhbS
VKASGIDYRYGNALDLDQVIEIYRASTLGERRPIDDRAVMAAMLANANLVVTAWDGETMVGIARTVTDFSYVGYLSDLAVRVSHQRSGIGTALIERTRARLGPRASLVLLSAPGATGYYPRIGFTRHESAWVLRPGQPFPVRSS